MGESELVLQGSRHANLEALDASVHKKRRLLLHSLRLDGGALRLDGVARFLGLLALLNHLVLLRCTCSTAFIIALQGLDWTRTLSTLMLPAADTGGRTFVAGELHLLTPGLPLPSLPTLLLLLLFPCADRVRARRSRW